MAITEGTRRIIAAQKAQLKQKIDANLSDIQAHQDAIARVEALNTRLQSDLDTLIRDIPAPAPVEPIARR